MNYYGLNRQGAAASGRYTRTPVPMDVPGIKSPFAAQALADPTAPALSDIAPQRRPGVPGQRDAPDTPDRPAASPEYTQAFDTYSKMMGYDQFGIATSPMKKAGVLGTIATAFGAPLSSALSYASSAFGPVSIGANVLASLNKGIPIARSAKLAAPELQRAREAEMTTGLPQDAARVRALAKHYPVSLATQAYRKVLDAVVPQKPVAPFTGEFGFGDPVGAQPGLGQPGSQPGDFGHEARMGIGVGDVAGTQESAGIPGTGDKPVGKDYGNRTEPGSAPGGEGGGVSGGGGYGPGVGGEGQSAGYK